MDTQKIIDVINDTRELFPKYPGYADRYGGFSYGSKTEYVIRDHQEENRLQKTVVVASWPKHDDWRIDEDIYNEWIDRQVALNLISFFEKEFNK